MTGNTNYKRLVEGYFEGSLSASEKADLEHQLEMDPGLKSEFDLQNAIIETIKETRRIELKSYLNNISVGWYHMIPNSWKVAAGITLFSVSSLSAFFLLEDTFKPELNNIDLSQGTESEQIETDKSTIPGIPEVTITIEETGKETYKLIEEAEEIPALEVTVKEVTPANVPMAVIPDMPSDFEEISNPDPMPEISEELTTFEPVTSSSSVLNMKTINDDKHQFHYTLSEGILLLYGNFKDSPYEIMDLYSSKGVQMYLFYKNNYYNLKKNTLKISPLELVTDASLITELDVLRQKK
ncbi:hypothetical protein ACFLU5_04095 [Bacteroidota bacterium]